MPLLSPNCADANPHLLAKAIIGTCAIFACVLYLAAVFVLDEGEDESPDGAATVQPDVRFPSEWQSIIEKFERQVAQTRRLERAVSARWSDAQRRGVVQETGTLYFVTRTRPVLDGSDEFTETRTSRPENGWFVTVRRSKDEQGRLVLAVKLEDATVSIGHGSK